MPLIALTGWHAQYARFERSFQRVSGRFQNSDGYVDALHHFMQDCWHLKDWIKNDPEASEAARRSVERAFNRHRALRLVVDLASAAKPMMRFDQSDGAPNDIARSDSGPSQNTDLDCSVELGNGSVWSVRRVIEDAHRDWHTVLAELALTPRA